MAAESTATEALYRALRTREPDPDLAHAAVEEIRNLASQNVIAVLGAQLETVRTQLAAQITELRAELRADLKAQSAHIDALDSRISGIDTSLGSRIDALDSRIDTLHKVIWPLIVILAGSVFGLLYKAVTG